MATIAHKVLNDSRITIAAACREILGLHEDHSLAEFGKFAEAKALAKLVLFAIDPPPTKIVVISARSLYECAEEIRKIRH